MQLFTATSIKYFAKHCLRKEILSQHRIRVGSRQVLGLVKCKSDHSYYSHHAPLTASQRLQAHKENALTELDTKILQCINFAYKVGIVISYLNIILESVVLFCKV